MPRRKQDPRIERAQAAEEVLAKLDECISLVGMIAFSLAETGNPPEMGAAWMVVATNLVAQRDRAIALAR